MPVLQLLWVLAVVLVVYLMPIAFAVWVLVTLRRIRDTQDAMRHQLAAIERSLPH
jgi:hypothetical protein